MPSSSGASVGARTSWPSPIKSSRRSAIRSRTILRRPLRAIDGFSATLGELCSGKLDALEKNYFDRIRYACLHMDRLIDALLSIARLSHQEMRHERIDLSALAEDLIHELRRREPHARRAGRDRGRIDGHRRRAFADALLENLLANAWKFTRRAITRSSRSAG